MNDRPWAQLVAHGFDNTSRNARCTTPGDAIKITTTATYLKNTASYLDANNDGKLDAAELDSLNTKEKAVFTAAARVLGLSSPNGMTVDAFTSVVNRLEEAAKYADEAGSGKARDNGYLSKSEAAAARLPKASKSALVRFAVVAGSRAEPRKLNQR